MDVIPMLPPWQWLVLAAVPPLIVLLYFLKLKRQPLEVPSTYLWHKSTEDLHVNSIWQRLRKSILLLLQLLFIGVLAFALLRPGWAGSKLTGDRFIFLIDTSASMSATDVQPTRLAEAKRRAGDLIEQMTSGDVAMIISFSDAARVEQMFTDNRRELARSLEAIQPTNRRTLLGEALRVAAGLANPARTAKKGDSQSAQGLPATMYIFSDGRFPDVEGFSLGNLQAVYVPIGNADAANIGTTAFNTRRRQDKRDLAQAFGRMENIGANKVTTEVELYRDGTLADADKLELEPRGSGGVVFELGDMHQGVLRLRTDQGGALVLDDEAWAVVEPPAPAKILLVTPGNDALELALNTDSASELAQVEVAAPGVLETDEYQTKAAAGYYSLVIYDRCQPKQMPQANTWFIGALPPGTAWAFTQKVDAPQIIDVETAHPLLQLIDLGDVRFVEGQAIRPPAGGTVLIDCHAGPLLAIAPREAFEDAVLGAPIVGNDDKGAAFANTDWPLRLSFPVFVMNAISYFGGSDTAGTVANVQPGATVELHSAVNGSTLAVRTPSGKVVSLSREGSETFSFSDTDELGVYQVEEPDQPPRRFAVNLFDSAESNIQTRPQINIGFNEVKGQGAWEGARRELWKLLLLGALGVLCLEWYIYNRRVYL